MWAMSFRINQQWNAMSHLLTREQNLSWGRVGSGATLIPQLQKGKHHSTPVLSSDSRIDRTKWYGGDKPLDYLRGMTKIRLTDVGRPAMCGWNLSMGWVLHWIKRCKWAPGFILLPPDCRFNTTNYFQLLLLCNLHHDGWYPLTVSHHNLFLP